MKFISAGSTSILFSTLAVLCPFALLMSGIFDPPKDEGRVCGLYVIIPISISLLSMGLLSFIGFVFGVIDYRHTTRSAWRKLEAVIVSTPFLLALASIIYIFVFGYL
ncbi:MAG: hypothetical protein ABSH41_08570 [Syntrophobacteraceae bacterium]